MPFVPGPQESVEKVSLERTSDQAISALKAVRLTSDTNVDLADSGGTYEEAITAGIATSTTASAGQVIDVQSYGLLEDPFFTFPLNDLLFLGSGGTITNVAPTSGHRVVIGKSLGTGSIFINIEEPISI